MERSTTEQLAATAILAEPVRRALYLHVLREARDVGRDEAAEAVGVDRALAAFHLDKLADSGLLSVSYQRLSGRTGPGAGRPSKLYRPSGHQIELSLPERRYLFLARLLAGAVGSSRAATAALSRAAHELGEAIGAEARETAGPRPSRERLMRSAQELLEGMGFQPRRSDDGAIRLRNCPFDALAQERRDLVCRANFELMDGVLQGLRVKGVQASLEPAAGLCCVALRGVAPRRVG